MSRGLTLLCRTAFACALGVPQLAHAAPATSAPVAPSIAPPSVSPIVVYLHAGGGRLVASERDDAPRFESNVVQVAGLPYVDVPAFQGAAGEWQQVMACVRTYYAGLPVQLVDQRPTRG